jgi:clan AA aspartic protease (TIGR02281 family)
VPVANLPMQVVANHVTVGATVNGKPVRLIVDTGGAQTLLTPEAAFRLELVQEASPTRTLEGIGGNRTAIRYRADTLQLGLLRGSSWAFLVSDIGWQAGSSTPDGILGTDFLWRYDLDLDVPHLRLLIYHPRHDCTAPTSYLTGRRFTVPLLEMPWARFAAAHPDYARANPIARYNFVNTPRVNVVVNGLTLTAAIDSGAPTSVLFRAAAHRVGISDAALASDLHGNAGGIGPAKVAASRHVLPRVNIGALTVHDMPVAVIDQTMPDGTDMLLGLDLLSRVHVWVSYSSNSLIVEVAQ